MTPDEARKEMLALIASIGGPKEGRLQRRLAGYPNDPKRWGRHASLYLQMYAFEVAGHVGGGAITSEAGVDAVRAARQLEADWIALLGFFWLLTLTRTQSEVPE